MNDHLISRNKFLDALALDADNKTDLIQVHQALEKAVQDPDEVRGVGEWIDYQQGRWVYAKCSECGTVHDVRSNYCPNCGARMSRAEAENAMEVSENEPI